MRPTGQVIVLAGVLAMLAPGCTTPRLFPENEGIPVHTSAEFGILFAQPDTYRYQTVRMAGRMVRIIDTGEGILIFAEWLPFPSTQEEGPIETERVHRQQFTLFYPGPVDSEGLMLGNKFLVLGKIEPRQTNVSPVGPVPRPLLF